MAGRGREAGKAALSAGLTVALGRLRAALDEGKVDKIPDGFLTAAAHAAAWSLSTQHAQRTLEEAVARGIAERKVFTIRSSSGAPRKVRHYKIDL